MSYVDKTLLPDEKVTYRAHLHWIIYGWACVLWIAAIALEVGAWRSGGNGRDIPAEFGGLLALVGALIFIYQWVQKATQQFAVTDKRVLIKSGLISRRTVELLLLQVQVIEVDQTFFGRILGFGTITLIGTGGTSEPFRRIADPLEFRRQVQMQSTAVTRGATPLPVSTTAEKTCPRCAESVKAAAKVCRFCGHEFAPTHVSD